MNITLISPYEDLIAYGIRILSACLKNNKHTVKLIFLPEKFGCIYAKKTLDELVELSSESDLIGISLMTDHFRRAAQITQKLKEMNDTPIIWGGVHPTVSPEECFTYADMVCIGEGEEALVELAKKMEAGEEYYNTQNIWFKESGMIIKNKLRPLIQNLDCIPFPDYDCGDHYILSNGRIQNMDNRLLSCFWGTGSMYLTIPSRGCLFACSYCCNNKFKKIYAEQAGVRKRSLKNVIKELVEIKSKSPCINEIWFDDDNFFAYTIDEIKEFCENYKTNIKLPLRIGGATPLTITKEKLSLLVDAGLTMLRMGIESGSERTKKLYKRYYTNKQIKNAARIINEFKNKLMPTYDIILDNPWENDKDLTETLMFLASLPAPYCITIFSLTFYPGTELYELAMKDGLITDKIKNHEPKDFYCCENTFLNKVFLLLQRYASKKQKIAPLIMSLLTNKTLKKLKISKFIYQILQIMFLFYAFLVAIIKGRYSEIIRYVNKRMFQNIDDGKIIGTKNIFLTKYRT